MKQRIAIAVALSVVVAGVIVALFRPGDSGASKPPAVARDTPKELERSRKARQALPVSASAAPGAAAEPPNPLPRRNFGTTEEAVRLDVPPSPEAEEERDEKLAMLRASGSGGGEWRDHFDDVSSEWRRIAAREHIALDVGAWECLAAGCAITLEFEALEDLETFSRATLAGISTKRWRGGGFRSGPIESASGKIAATWIFSAPQRH